MQRFSAQGNGRGSPNAQIATSAIRAEVGIALSGHPPSAASTESAAAPAIVRRISSRPGMIISTGLRLEGAAEMSQMAHRAIWLAAT